MTKYDPDFWESDFSWLDTPEDLSTELEELEQIGPTYLQVDPTQTDRRYLKLYGMAQDLSQPSEGELKLLRHPLLGRKALVEELFARYAIKGAMDENPEGIEHLTVSVVADHESPIDVFEAQHLGIIAEQTAINNGLAGSDLEMTHEPSRGVFRFSIFDRLHENGSFTLEQTARDYVDMCIVAGRNEFQGVVTPKVHKAAMAIVGSLIQSRPAI